MLFNGQKFPPILTENACLLHICEGELHIEVEQTPADVISGGDPQLEKAIEVVLEQLRQNPPKEPVRPPYPVRVRK